MITSARVDIDIYNNVTWQDAYQFGVAGDTTWSFTGQHFICEVKADKDDTTALFTLTDLNGRIVVDDAVTRVLHFQVDYVTLRAALPNGEYHYDLVMYDTAVPAVRVNLMHGELKIKQGISGAP